MALGGRSAAMVRLVLREGLTMVGAGGLLGLAGILAMGRVLQSQLFGVRPSDPLIIAGIVASSASLRSGRASSQRGAPPQ